MSYKLLLAEDSAAIQQVVQLAFNGEDVDVVVAGDGSAAIAAVERDAPDVVLADVRLPGTDGYDLAFRIGDGADGSAPPVVLLAGAFEPVDRDRAKASGCRDILIKPFVPRDLVTRVMTLLDPEYVAPPETEPHEAERTDPEPVAELPAPATPAPHPVPVRVQPVPEPIAVAPAPEPILATPQPQPVEVSEPTSQTALAHRPILAQAFATFLAAEHELAPRSQALLTSVAAPAAIPSGLGDALKRELTRRVRRRLTKAFVRDMAERVVSKAVDRIVREELARMNVRPPAE